MMWNPKSLASASSATLSEKRQEHLLGFLTYRPSKVKAGKAV